LTVPAGQVSVQVIKGFEHKIDKREIQVAANQQEKVTIQLQPLAIPKESGVRWASADLHVHMNYAGSYRNTPEQLVQQGEAENLALIENLVVNKEQRIPDMSYFRTDADPASTSDLLLMPSQEFHTSYWGHLGVLSLTRNFLIPDYSAYPNTAAASLVPTNGDVADLAHSQGATVGYVHPFETFPDPSKPEPLTDELPVDVALGKVDYIEVLGFSDHKSTAAVWYRLLNCGFRLPTGAGTDAMANFASLHGPVGLDRVYAQVPEGPLRANQWLESLRHGHTFATNGPLLGFKLGDRQLGDELKLDSPQQQVKFTAWMRSIIPVDHLQIICNGEVVRELPLGLQRDTLNTQGALPMTKSGWCLLRAWNEKSADAVLDAYPYATTSPIYVTVADTPVKSAGDAAYFIAWIDRIKGAVENYPDWNTPAEKTSVMKQLSDARAIYAAQLK
jgi:hypothetical protein